MSALAQRPRVRASRSCQRPERIRAVRRRTTRSRPAPLPRRLAPQRARVRAHRAGRVPRSWTATCRRPGTAGTTARRRCARRCRRSPGGRPRGRERGAVRPLPGPRLGADPRRRSAGPRGTRPRLLFRADETGGTRPAPADRRVPGSASLRQPAQLQLAINGRPLAAFTLRRTGDSIRSTFVPGDALPRAENVLTATALPDAATPASLGGGHGRSRAGRGRMDWADLRPPDPLPEPLALNDGGRRCLGAGWSRVEGHVPLDRRPRRRSASERPRSTAAPEGAGSIRSWWRAGLTAQRVNRRSTARWATTLRITIRTRASTTSRSGVDGAARERAALRAARRGVPPRRWARATTRASLSASRRWSRSPGSAARTPLARRPPARVS